VDAHLCARGLDTAPPRKQLRSPDAGGRGDAAARGEPPAKRRARGAVSRVPIAALLEAAGADEECGAAADKRLSGDDGAGLTLKEQRRRARLERERSRLAYDNPGRAFLNGEARVRRVRAEGEDDEPGAPGGGEAPAAADGGAAPGAAAAAERAAKPPRAPRPRKPSKPWQPKPEKDEPNWRGAEGFAEFVAAAEASLAKSALKAWPRAQPAHETARLAVLVLLHAPGWPNWRVWEEWARAHPEGEVVLFVHMKVRRPMVTARVPQQCTASVAAPCLHTCRRLVVARAHALAAAAPALFATRSRCTCALSRRSTAWRSTPACRGWRPSSGAA
jgi:hypothetical protein